MENSSLTFVFLISSFLSAFAWTFFLTPRENKVTPAFIAKVVFAWHALVLFSGLPLVALRAWALSYHLGVIVLVSIPVLFLQLKNTSRLSFSDSKSRWLFFLCILGAGFLLQKDSILHFYATHDTASYLNAAFHIKRTGSAIHKDELTELAYGKGFSSLKEVLSLENTPDYLSNDHFGVIPSNKPKGEGSFHGFVGAPLFFATGFSLFGETHGIKIQWITLLGICLWLVAILQILAGTESMVPWLAPVFYLISPLVAPLFRMTLSEPLTSLCFLTIVYSLFDLRKYKNPLSIALGLSLVVRVSSLMYLPFLAYHLYVTKEYKRADTAKLTAVILGSLGIVGWLNPNYFTEILSTHGNQLLNLSTKHPWLLVTGLTVGTYCFYFLRHHSKIWKYFVSSFIAITILGLCYRYYHLYFLGNESITTLYVSYSLFESLFFYGCPWIVMIGLYFYLKKSISNPNPPWAFLQLFVPFLLFFYGVFFFGILGLQVYHQRYLLTELIPLSIIGFLTWVSSKKYFNDMGRIGALSALSLIWLAGITFSINHKETCLNSKESFESISGWINQQKQPGRKQIIALVTPSWRDMTFFAPLDFAFGNSLIFINHPESEETRKALNLLKEWNYDVIFANQTGKEIPPMLSLGEHWTEAKEWRNCYRYPKLGSPVPPVELDTSCGNFTFYKRETQNPIVSR